MVVGFPLANLDGAIAYLLQSDESIFQTRSDFGQTQMELLVAATADIPAPTSMSVLIESRIGQPLGTAEIRLHSWTTGQFHTLGNMQLVIEITNWFDEIDATDGVDTNGEIELSIKYTLHVPIPFNRSRSNRSSTTYEITVLN